MKKQSLFIIIALLFVLTLASCKVIDTIQDNLEVSGYDVVKDEEQAVDAYIAYTVYEQTTVVAYIYEFPSFVKARNYYWDEDFENRDDGMTWIIHNQLIVGAGNQDVLAVITGDVIDY